MSVHKNVLTEGVKISARELIRKLDFLSEFDPIIPPIKISQRLSSPPSMSLEYLMVKRRFKADGDQTVRTLPAHAGDDNPLFPQHAQYVKYTIGFKHGCFYIKVKVPVRPLFYCTGPALRALQEGYTSVQYAGELGERAKKERNRHHALASIRATPSDTAHVYLEVQDEDAVICLLGLDSIYCSQVVVPNFVLNTGFEFHSALGIPKPGAVVHVVAPNLDGNQDVLWGVVKSMPNAKHPQEFSVRVLQRKDGLACFLKKGLSNIFLDTIWVHWRQIFRPECVPNEREACMLQAALGWDKNWTSIKSNLDQLNAVAFRRLFQRAKVIYGPYAGLSGFVGKAVDEAHLEILSFSTGTFVTLPVSHVRGNLEAGDEVSVDSKGKTFRGFIKSVNPTAATAVVYEGANKKLHKATALDSIKLFV
ncbi:hypothetical protein NMY22_g4634 [Coprinellus aureogranulatus]|nr:hypothetical protein NMY22_g4634 [Coprinellus aureogranulatus]